MTTLRISPLNSPSIEQCELQTSCYMFLSSHLPDNCQVFNFCPPSPSSLCHCPLSPVTTSVFFSVSLFLISQVSEIIQHLCFSSSYIYVPSRSIHNIVNVRISFFLIAEQYSSFMYRNFFINTSIDGHLDFFHVQSIENNAAINMGCC